MQTIDYIIIVTYLVATVALGVHRGWRIWNISDYAMGGRRYDTLFLILILFSTIMGVTSTMGVVEQVFQKGLCYSFSFAIAFSQFFIALFFVHHLPKFSNCLSIASVMGSVYGKGARLLVAMFGFLYLAVILGVQLKGLGRWAEALMGISSFKGILFVAGITLLYAVVGGMRGIVTTDILQFFLIAIGLPTVCYFAVRSIGGFGTLFSALPMERINPLKIPNFMTECFPMWILFMFPIFEPHMAQRLLMAKNPQQARNGFLGLGCLMVLFFSMLSLLGLIVYVKTPHIPASQAFTSILLTALPVGIKGLVIVAVLAIIMSTADALINTCGVLFAHDIVNPLLGNRLSGYRQMVLARYACIVVGILAIWVACHFHDLFMLIIFRRMFWFPTFLVPILLTFLGYRTKVWRFYTAAITGVICFVLWDKLLTPSIRVSAFLPAMLANLLVFLDFRALKKSWDEKRIAKREKSVQTKSFWQKLWSIPSFSKLNAICERNLSLNEAPWLLFSAFMLINYILPVFMWRQDYVHFRAAITLRIISTLALSIMLLSNHWPAKLQVYRPLYWHFILVLSLPFVATFYLLDAPSCFSSLNVMLALLWLFFIVNGRTFTTLSLIGLIGGYFTHTVVNYIWPETFPWKVTFDTFYPSLYFGFFALTVAILFIRKSRLQTQSYLRGLQQMSQSVANGAFSDLCALRLSSQHHTEMLLEKSKQNSDGNIPSKEELEASILQQNKLFQNMLTTLEWKKATIENFFLESSPAINPVKAKTILQDVLAEYPFEGSDKARVSFLQTENDFTFMANEKLLKWALFHLVKNVLQATKNTSSGKVTLRSQFYKAEGWLVVENNVGNTDEDIIKEQLQGIDYSQDLGIELNFAHKVIKVMGGKIHCISEPNSFTRFLILFNRVE